ncbi:methyltransferase [Histoplasma capsulatum var. duboisii H88]|uniref:Methyltransferase n=2 Tax=Ajellomyces capsulatus TaxID=5037 RepID=F0U7P0_AJEC8|nr:methyltransferase [Histoplasma capsulatum H143]EGC41609.1 methyltransferase [Histoplasma capsulatum var. duboisii H88]
MVKPSPLAPGATVCGIVTARFSPSGLFLRHSNHQVTMVVKNDFVIVLAPMVTDLYGALRGGTALYARITATIKKLYQILTLPMKARECHETTIMLEVPNDEQEQDRMDLNHHIYRTLLDGGLYLAPVPESVGRVLDLGTGTGNDLSPIQPSWVPPNCKFEVDDFESTWSYAQPFDFIHAREMEGMVKDYDKLFQQAYKHLNPQGWMEIQSIELDFFGDETIVKAKEFRRWRDLVIEASEKFGKPMTQVSTWADRMKKVGFKNVKAEHRILPFSPWPKNEKLKELGRYHQLQMFQALGAYSSAPLIRILGWKPSEVEILLAAVRRDLKDRSIHIYTKVHFIYGQKVVD